MIVATDGVWDNLDMQNLNTNIDDCSNLHLKTISEQLFSEVIQNSDWEDVKRRGYQSVKDGFYGAKKDDVTLMIAGLVQNDN